MKIGLIGSMAAAHQMDIGREPSDMDIVGSYQDIQAFVAAIRASGERVLSQYPVEGGDKVFIRTDKRIIEAEVAWEGSTAAMMLELIEDTYGMSIYGVHVAVASLDLLYVIKMSHRYKKNSVHFQKTRQDILAMRKEGAEIVVEYEGFYKARQKATYDNTLPKLNTSRVEFFDNANSIYTLDHDSLHEAIKRLPRPAYEYFKADAAEVMCSKDMFFALDEQIKLYAALEEVEVLSLERSIHPFPDVDKRWAFNMAHEKLSTSISGGWFREYVWENYDKVQEMYDASYVDKFYAALAAGQIQPFKGETK